MKNIAFVLDPDGYWVEIVQRSPKSTYAAPFNLSQTMIRVKDPVKSVQFYQKYFGMSLIKKKHFADFSLYFLASVKDTDSVPTDSMSVEAEEFMKGLWDPVLELTHNHGTEEKSEFSYHNGNDAPQGFGHLAFICDDVKAFSDELAEAGILFKKKLEDGRMNKIAFVLDPDNYWIEIVPRGVHL